MPPHGVHVVVVGATLVLAAAAAAAIPWLNRYPKAAVTAAFSALPPASLAPAAAKLKGSGSLKIQFEIEGF